MAAYTTTSFIATPDEFRAAAGRPKRRINSGLGTPVFRVLILLSLCLMAAVSVRASDDITQFELDSGRDPDLLPYRFIEHHSQTWSGVDYPVAGAMKVFKPAVGDDTVAYVVHVYNSEHLSLNPATIALVNATQWRTVDHDPVYGLITGYAFFRQHSEVHSGVVAGLLRNDSAFVVRSYPGTDSLDVLYLTHGEDLNGSGSWDGSPNPCLVDDYDHDGVEEVFVYVDAGRDLRPRMLFCIDPGRLAIEWSLPLAGAVSWGNIYVTGDSLDPEFILVTYNFKNGVSDRYFDDNYCYLARISSKGVPVFRAVISDQHGGRGLWRAVRPDEFLLFHALPLISPDSLDHLPPEKYQLSLIDSKCRTRVTIDVPQRVSDAWKADYDNDGRADLYTLTSTGAIRIYDADLNLIAQCPSSNLTRRIGTVRLNGQRDPVYLFETSDGMRMYTSHFRQLAAIPMRVQEAYPLSLDSHGNTRVILLSNSTGAHSEQIQQRSLSSLLGILFWRYRDTIIGILTLLVITLVIVNARRQAAVRRLLESEDRLRSIFDNATEGFYRADLEGRLIWVSPAAARMVGHDDPAELCGTLLSDLYVHPQERDQLLEEIRRTGRVNDYRVELRRRDGGSVLMSANSYRCFDRRGRPVGVEGVIRDITEQRAAEIALQVGEEKYRLLVENVRAAISVVDADGMFLFVNEVAASTLGKNPEDIIGRRQWDIFPGPVADRQVGNIRKVIESGEELALASEIPIGGETRYYFSNLQPYRDDTGLITAALVVAHDITDLRKAELKAQRLSRALEQSMDGIAIVSMDGICEYANDSWARMHGYGAEDMIGKHIRLCHSERQMREEVQPFVEMLRERGAHQGELGHVTRDGVEFPAFMSATLLKDGAGEATGIVATVRDISEQKRAQQALQENEEKFRSLAEYSLQGIYLTRNDRIEFANQRISDILEMPLEEFIGMDPRELTKMLIVDEASRNERLLSYEARTHGREKSFHQVVRIRTPKGNERWVETLSHVFFIKGKPAIQGVVADITEERQSARRLSESEARYRQLVESAGEAIFSLDRKGRFTFANSIVARVTGKSADELIGSSLWETLPEADTEEAREILRRAFEYSQPGVSENIITVDGERRVYRTTIQPICDNDRTPGTVLAIARDVTDTVQSQEELRRERDFVRSLLDTANGLVVCLDSNARITIFNKECERVTGYRRDEVLGQRWPDLFLPKEYRHKGLKDFAAWVRQHPHDVYEGPLNTKSGEVRTVLWSNTALFLPDGTLTAIAVGQDITDRIRAEQALRDSEQFNRVVLERSPLGISVRSRTGRLLSYNEAWMNIWQVSEENLSDYQVRDRRSLQFDHRDSYLGEWLPKVREIYEHGGYLHIPEIRTTRPRPDGGRWMSQYFYAIRDEQGTVDRVVIITEDITQRKRAEAEALTATRAKVEQAKNIAGGFAHEIRNALFPAEGALFRLTEGANGDMPASPRLKHYTEAAIDAVCRAIDITELISHYTKLETERMPEEVNVASVLNDVLQANDIRLRDQSVDVSVEGLDGRLIAVSNARQLYSVLNNILLNSLDALTGRAEPAILVRVTSDTQSISLTLRDNGQGIPQKDLHRIFDAFYSSKPSGGTGLGLAVAKKIVEMYDGHISVCSEPGQGTETIVVLRTSSEFGRTTNPDVEKR